MKALFRHRSNQLGALASELAKHLVSAGPPFEKRVVAVPSLAMRRWLTLQLAELGGVCANIAFPFVSDFIRALPKEILSKSGITERFDLAEMTWRIFDLLPALPKERSSVAAYLADSDHMKRYQLAARTAALFDQYAVYRPEMLQEWQHKQQPRTSEDARWQATLWRRLSEPNRGAKASAEDRFNDIEAALESGSPVYLFGLGEIPPLYLRAVFELAFRVPVHLFELALSSEYYGDQPTEKIRAKRRLKDELPGTVNPLLSSMARANSQLNELVLAADEAAGHKLVDATEAFIVPQPINVLTALQADIVSARDNRDQPAEAKWHVREDDQSILVHSCHSPLREVEVLYDRLLALFDADPTLRPRDVLVMAPQIETYSPLVHAVFGYAESEARAIPYSISDRQARSQSTIIDTFLRFLELAPSRWTAAEVYGFISSEPVARRFELSTRDLAVVHDWIRESGICWGMDAEHRARLGLPAFDLNTWRYGLNRLLLGYAIRGEERELFEGILPYDEIEGESGELLGRFLAAVETLLTYGMQLSQCRSLSDWSSFLRAAADSLLESDDDDELRDLRFLRRTIAELERHELIGEVELRVVGQHLSDLLGQMEQRGGFLKGKVTFCALKPGRSIPARVVCLLGLNDAVFPRRPQPLEFDLMSTRRSGDPSPREDDRQAFLESVCAARDHVHLSYIGRSANSNNDIPPSVVVTELLDYLARAFVFPGKCRAETALQIQHPLQPFSPEYFDPKRSENRLFSFSELNARAAANIARSAPTATSPFLTRPVPLPSEEAALISLPALVSALAGPAQAFLRQRFGINLSDYDADLPDEDPIEPNQLDQYHIRQQLLEQWVEGDPPDLNVFLARGAVAAGESGKLQLRCLNEETEAFHNRVRLYLGTAPKDPPLLIDQRFGAISLSGYVSSLYSGQLVHYRCGLLNVRDYLRAWVEHLARCASASQSACRAILIGRDKVVGWQHVDKASLLLRDLCKLYQEILTGPVPLFPKSGFAFVEAEQRGGNALSAARQAWGLYGAKENEDAAIRFLFDEPDPLSDESIRQARRLFRPLLDNLEAVGPK